MYPESPNKLTIPLIIASFFAVAGVVLAVYYFMQYRQASTNLDGQIAVAVEEAEAAKTVELEADFAERSKSPNDVYRAPSQLGSVAVTYPKTWSSYVIEDSGSGTVLEGYFHPGTVPDVRGAVPFALRVELDSTEYDGEVEKLQRAVEKGELKASAVRVNGELGVRFDGQIDRDISGAIVLLPLRDRTLKIWTENPDYLKDFNDIILPQLTFVP